tara:strand:- start:130 stop:366 length:237 start_codon:yes stop_codon:yes gene_type:complete
MAASDVDNSPWQACGATACCGPDTAPAVFAIANVGIDPTAIVIAIRQTMHMHRLKTVLAVDNDMPSSPFPKAALHRQL